MREGGWDGMGLKRKGIGLLLCWGHCRGSMGRGWDGGWGEGRG